MQITMLIFGLIIMITIVQVAIHMVGPPSILDVTWQCLAGGASGGALSLDCQKGRLV